MASRTHWRAADCTKTHSYIEVNSQCILIKYLFHTETGASCHQSHCPDKGRDERGARARPPCHVTTNAVWSQYSHQCPELCWPPFILSANTECLPWASLSAKVWGLSSVSTYGKISNMGFLEVFGWETGLLCWFHGMTETVFKEVKPWLAGNWFLLSSFPEAVCSLYFLFLFSSAARRQALHNC